MTEPSKEKSLSPKRKYQHPASIFDRFENDVKYVFDCYLPPYILMITNAMVFIALTLWFSSHFRHAYAGILATQLHAHTMLGSDGLAVFFRVAFYIPWIMSESPWSRTLQISLLPLLWLLFTGRTKLAGCWLLLIQLLILLQLHLDSSHMSAFVYYYDALFSVQPLQPPT